MAQGTDTIGENSSFGRTLPQFYSISRNSFFLNPLIPHKKLKLESTNYH